MMGKRKGEQKVKPDRKAKETVSKQWAQDEVFSSPEPRKGRKTRSNLNSDTPVRVRTPKAQKKLDFSEKCQSQGNKEDKEGKVVGEDGDENNFPSSDESDTLSSDEKVRLTFFEFMLIF